MKMKHHLHCPFAYYMIVTGPSNDCTRSMLIGIPGFVALHHNSLVFLHLGSAE